MSRRDASSKRDAKWVTRGIVSACECFSCANKVSHRLKGNRVSILCRDPCRYTALQGETRPSLYKMEDTDRVS